MAGPNILFCMRYPDDEGFVWKTVAQLRDIVAGELAERNCFIAFPKLTGRSVHQFAHLQPVELDCYQLNPNDRAALRQLVAAKGIGAIVYMSALPTTLDLGFLRKLGLVTINTEEDSFGPGPPDPLHRRWAKFVVRRLLGWQLHDLHIANSWTQGELLRQHAQIPPGRLAVIPNGIDCTRFTPGPASAPPVLDPARRWVICVSQARAEKRVDLILRCAARIARQPAFDDVSFVYVGAGERLDHWRQLAQELGIADRVHFAGRQEDLLPWYRAASLMVHAARRESFGLVLAEAMACALPIVATEAAGPREVIANGETGRLVAVDDEDGFAAAIEHYLNNPGLARRHGLAGHDRANRLFSIHRQGAAIATAIRQVLDR